MSVDTYKPAVAEAAIAAGAVLVNDVSGLRDPALADVCARTGAALVIMHTRVEPKGTLLDPGALRRRRGRRHGLPARADGGRAGARRGAGADRARPGARLRQDARADRRGAARDASELRALGRPLLWAVSNKDFVGAITGRPPRERLAGTLAAVAAGVAAGAAILRVHDVAAAADFLRVRAVFAGEVELAPDEGLGPDRYPA